jgi:MFS family permease
VVTLNYNNLTGNQYMPVTPFIAWRQLFVCFMLMGAVGMIASTYSLIAVPLANEFQPSRTVLMLAMTVLSGSCAVLSPLLGTLMDRISIRLMMTTGGVLLAAGYYLLSITTDFSHVLIIFGVLIAPANVLIGPVAITVLLTRWFTHIRGRAIGIAIAGISAGGFIYPFIIQGFLETHEWRDAFQLLSLVLLVWTVPAALMVVSQPSNVGLQVDGDSVIGNKKLKIPISARQIVTDPAFWMLAVTVAIVTAGMKGMITNLAPLAIESSVSLSDAAPLISVYAACSFIAKLNFAALSDRLGPRVLMGIALTGFSAGMLCLSQASMGYYVIALGVAITGLFGGLMIPIESYIAPRIFGQQAVGRAMGLLSGTILIALLATPPLFGFIFDVFGSYKGIFWVFAGMALAALVWLPKIRLHPRDYTAASVKTPAVRVGT